MPGYECLAHKHTLNSRLRRRGGSIDAAVLFTLEAVKLRGILRTENETQDY